MSVVDAGAMANVPSLCKGLGGDKKERASSDCGRKKEEIWKWRRAMSINGAAWGRRRRNDDMEKEGPQ